MIEIKSFGSGSSGNLYYVKNEKTKILLECGMKKEAIVKKIWEYDRTLIANLNAILISHSHT